MALYRDEKTDFPLATVETKAFIASGNDVEDCDIFKYQRNATEDWETFEVVDGCITVNGEKRFIGGITIDLEGKIRVKVPICKYAIDNCCEKAHLDKEYRIIN